MRNILNVFEIIAGIIGMLIIGLIMVVVFLFSFRFFLMFGPFIILGGMIRDVLRKRRG